MIYPANFEAKVGFDKIRSVIETFCLSDMGKQKVREMDFSADFDVISEKLEITEEFRQILLSVKPFPAQDYYDLREELERLKTEGTYIEIEKMGELRCSLITLTEIQNYFRKSGEQQYPRLRQLVSSVFTDESIIKYIDRILDAQGNIRNNASPELKNIRESQEALRELIARRIRQIYLELKKQGVTAGDAEITIRNGRSVIPLPAANKRRIRGFIHDESATGQTVYIEPEEIFELNNDLRELEIAERREIVKILTRFTDFIRPSLEGLLVSYDILAELDFIRAKAAFAIEIHALPPKITKSLQVDFKKAVNPILYLSYRNTGKKVVPLDVHLDREHRILVISGPNAGGKSVCLKTVGLLQYMLQCGLLIPAGDDSEPGIFRDLFIEIGDEQSLENDLSTYSSHLQNIKKLTEIAGERLLFLIDEFGSGTEPQAGGAIAEAVLEQLSLTQALGMVTTHYRNLKLMAGKIPGIVNGAMLFDTRKMMPLYIMKTGKPGSSFAFEIAGNIGLSEQILTRAAELAGKNLIDFEKQLQEFENERREFEKQKTEFEIADELLKNLVERYNSLNENIEKKRREILENARKEASELLKNAGSLIERTIREIQESKADKNRTQKARKEIAGFLRQINSEEETPDLLNQSEVQEEISKKQKKEKIRSQKIKNLPVIKGGFARIKGKETVFEIEDIKNNVATLVSSHMKLRISVDMLEATDEKPGSSGALKTRNPYYEDISKNLNERVAAFNPQIDLRGKRAEEVLPVIQHYLDEAVLLNIEEVRIIHGKGNGVLRQIVRDYLRTVAEVKSFGDETPEKGGNGITRVWFK